MNILTNLSNMEQLMQNALNDQLQTTSVVADSEKFVSPQSERQYLSQIDEESSSLLLNELGLAIQRQGGSY